MHKYTSQSRQGTEHSPVQTAGYILTTKFDRFVRMLPFLIMLKNGVVL